MGQGPGIHQISFMPLGWPDCKHVGFLLFGNTYIWT